MPDRFPLPPGGPQPFDERDLDSLLAGKTSDIPVALRPVAETLSALRADPAPRELRGEALVRAAFRDPRPESPAAPSDVLGRTARRRRVRRPPRGWMTGLVAAAAVVAAATVTYTGNLPGPAQQIAHDTIAAPPVRSHPAASPQPSVQVSSAQPAPVTPDPDTSATPASPPAQPSASLAALCDALWNTRQQPQPGGRTRWWQTPQYRQLIAAAGGPQKVDAYCSPVWQEQQPGHRGQWPPSSPSSFPSQRASSQSPPMPGQGQQSGNGSGGSGGGTQQPTGSPSTGSGNNSPEGQDG